MVKLLRVLLSAGFGVCLASCSVYVPMLPVAPQIRDKGQLEVQGTTFLNGRWEGGASYSPLRHVLVRAAGDWKNDTDDTTFFRIRQFEAGVGTYWPLAERWLVSGLAGYGRAHSRRGYEQINLFSANGNENVELRSRYHKVFGEVSAAYRSESGAMTLGAAYRLSRVEFEQLTYNGAPLALDHMLRSEPMLFARFGNPEGPLRWAQVQTSMGITSVPGYRYDPMTEPNEYYYIKEGRGFVAISLILLPHLFKSQPLPAPQ